MDSILTALALAGFVLAHAIDVLSEPQVRDLTPVAFVARGNDQKFITFEGATLEDMVARGKRELADGRYDAWAFAYEGFVTIDGKRSSAVFVHSWMRGLDTPVVIAQAWERTAEGAGADYLGPAVLLTESTAPRSGQRATVDPKRLDENQLRVLAAGIEEYEKLGASDRKLTH
jgi:hypothetical protein